MPTYEYKCLDCFKIFEIFQSMKDEPIKVCPECNGKLNRLIGSGAGTIFKGSGFYQTDYKNFSSNQNKKNPEKTNISTEIKESKSNSKASTEKKEK